MTSKRSPGPVLAAALLGVAALAGAFYFKPLPALEDKSLLQSDAAVRVEEGRTGILFAPVAGTKPAGLVFYCGARVPPESYAYLARACAEAGYAAVLASMPLNFALLDPDRAARAAAENPGVARWVIGGHSLGGEVAASFVARNASLDLSPNASAAKVPVGGLFLLAAYPAKGADLSALSLNVVTVGASRDPFASPVKIAAARDLLPPESRYVEIAGGNNAQFGEYGAQPGDGLAEIPGSTQRRAVVEEALGLLERVEAGSGK